jgi:hypothetical protein
VEQLSGNLHKLVAVTGTPVQYSLPIGEDRLPLNMVLGKTLRIEYAGKIHCVACGRPTKKSFNQGYCYPCFRTLARCDLCIVKPELCHYAQGTCREPGWGWDHCMQPHYVYFANTSGPKVGITRENQIPTRWLDQGAVQALLCFRVPSRHQAGILEAMIRQHLSDRTDWRRMLRGEPERLDLKALGQEVLTYCRGSLPVALRPADGSELAPLHNAEVYTFTYPILSYPTRVTALNLDTTTHIEGMLLGIKGQYLILDCGVLNVRKFTGYHVTVKGALR